MVIHYQVKTLIGYNRLYLYNSEALVSYRSVSTVGYLCLYWKLSQWHNKQTMEWNVKLTHVNLSVQSLTCGSKIDIREIFALSIWTYMSHVRVTLEQHDSQGLCLLQLMDDWPLITSQWSWQNAFRIHASWNSLNYLWDNYSIDIFSRVDSWL